MSKQQKHRFLLKFDKREREGREGEKKWKETEVMSLFYSAHNNFYGNFLFRYCLHFY